jgi:hypothetical protein
VTSLRFVFLAPLFCAWGASPWLPGAGKALVTTTYVNERFQDAWAGPTLFDLPGAVGLKRSTHLEQSTVYAVVEYGISDRVAFDALTGYTRTSFNKQSLDGTVDSMLGIRWQAWRGERSVLTLRGAGIIAGSYPQSNSLGPFNPGDKASGALVSALVGTSYSHGIHTYLEAGYKYREGTVPNAFAGSAGILHRVRGFSYGIAFQENRSQNGLDIFQATWTPSRFGETKQIQHILDGNLGYTTRKGLYFGFDYGRVVHGRNTGRKNIVAFTFGFALPTIGPHALRQATRRP